MKRNEILNALRGSNSKIAKRIPEIKVAREALSGIYNASQSRALSDAEIETAKGHMRDLHKAMREHTGGQFALLNH